MKRHLIRCFFMAAILMAATAVQAQQEKCRITRYSGETMSAAIIDMTKDVVEADISGSTEKIPAGDIEKITYAGEPAQMTDAREYIVDSRFEEAIEGLKSIAANQLKQFSKRERDYLEIRAYAGCAFSGTMPINKVLERMDKYFASSDNQKYYRFYEVAELYGNLNMLIGSDSALKKASKAFESIQDAKDAPVLKARALLGFGTIALMQEKPKDAEKSFKEILSMVRNQELEGVKIEMEVAASCGLARAQVQEGETDAAIKAIQKIFNESKVSQEDPINARLYNALGYALLTAKKPKDAAIAYMHTHLLYPTDKQLHLEALDAMIKIFRTELRDEQRAQALEAAKDHRYGSKKN